MIELGEVLVIRQYAVTQEINEPELVSKVSRVSTTGASTQLFNIDLAGVRVVTIHGIGAHKLWLI